MNNYSSDKSNIDQQMRFVKQKYVSRYNLQARQWKIIQKSAYETVHKNWSALSIVLKSSISRHKKNWNDSELHYAYWLVSNPKRLVKILSSKAPLPENFDVEYLEQKKVRNYLRRIVKRKRNHRPTARLS